MCKLKLHFNAYSSVKLQLALVGFLTYVRNNRLTGHLFLKNAVSMVQESMALLHSDSKYKCSYSSLEIDMHINFYI